MIADDQGTRRQRAERDAAGLVARPGLFGRLAGEARVTVVSAPPGSGKTVLLRSWISHAGLAERAGWVAAGRDERDPQRFWVSVLDALRGTAPGSGLVQALSPAPDLDGWVIAERLLSDLALLRERVWLIVDDAHELDAEALRQLELLIMRAPPGLRFVLASRYDVQLGLHRLRLEGELEEIRAADLQFTVAEARELFDGAGLELPEPALVSLVVRTEGWAAGLRLAVLSLTGYRDPERFAMEFSGSERTVAEYLLAEVLNRQNDQVRRLLLRTSILEVVNGQLADLLTGDQGGERMLQDLEQANAFVTSLNPARSSFRYHQMFADLLQLELRRTAPEQVTALHRAASGWFASNGRPVEAVRHAQSAHEWALAARLLADHWPGLHLDGQDATVHELLAAFPPGAHEADAELAALTAADELAHGSLKTAERYLELAENGLASADGRAGQARLLLGIVRLLLARQRGNLSAEAQEAQRLQAMAETLEAMQTAVGEELRALALISLRYAQSWTARYDPAEHPVRGIELARRIGRPYLEFTGLAYQAAIEASRSMPSAVEHARQAIALAERHGWSDQTAAGVACTALAGALAWQGKLDEAESWLRRAERAIRPETEVVAALAVQYIRGQMMLARGKDQDALAAFRAAERLAGQLAAPHPFARPVHAWLAHTLVRLGETQQAGGVLARLSEQERQGGAIRVSTAVLRLALHDPRGAVAVLAPVLHGSVRVGWPPWLVEALILEAVARDALGDHSAAARALERALEEAETGGVMLWFVLHPVQSMLDRNAARYPTANLGLINQVHGLVAANDPASAVWPPAPAEPVSNGELRVLRYLPTSLTAPEIASELSVSRHTVKTHMRNLYAKLGTHCRTETVTRARELGLLAPGGQRVRKNGSSQSKLM
jgi:LuxR family transcriptional regulator, maltose regulon positive regulatory protein